MLKIPYTQVLTNSTDHTKHWQYYCPSCNQQTTWFSSGDHTDVHACTTVMCKHCQIQFYKTSFVKVKDIKPYETWQLLMYRVVYA